MKQRRRWFALRAFVLLDNLLSLLHMCIDGAIQASLFSQLHNQICDHRPSSAVVVGDTGVVIQKKNVIAHRSTPLYGNRHTRNMQ